MVRVGEPLIFREVAGTASRTDGVSVGRTKYGLLGELTTDQGVRRRIVVINSLI